MNKEFKIGYIIRPSNRAYDYLARVAGYNKLTKTYEFELVTSHTVEKHVTAPGHRWNVSKDDLFLFEIVLDSTELDSTELDNTEIVNIVKILSI